MDFDKFVQDAKIMHKAIKRGIEKVEKQKAAAAMYDFIVYGIVTTVITVVLSLILPYWLVGIIFAVIGILRFAESYNKIETGIQARSILQIFNLWGKKNDDILIGYVIYGAVVFVVIQIIKFTVTPRTPFIGIGIIKFFTYIPVILVLGLLVLFITLIVSVAKKDAKYITVSFVILFPLLLPLFGIYILEGFHLPGLFAVLAAKNVIEKTIFYLSIALLVDTIITTCYKYNFSSTYKWKIPLCLLLAVTSVLIYLDKIELIKDTFLYYKNMYRPDVHIALVIFDIVFVIVGIFSITSVLFEFIKSVFSKRHDFSSFIDVLCMAIVYFGFLFGYYYIGQSIPKFLASVIGILAGLFVSFIVDSLYKKKVRPLFQFPWWVASAALITGLVYFCIYFSVHVFWIVILSFAILTMVILFFEEEKGTGLSLLAVCIPIPIICPIVLAYVVSGISGVFWGLLLGTILDLIIGGIIAKNMIAFSIPFLGGIPIVSAFYFGGLQPLDMFVFLAVVFGLSLGIVLDFSLAAIYKKQLNLFLVPLLVILPIIVPILIAYSVGGFFAVTAALILCIIASIMLIIFIIKITDPLAVKQRLLRYIEKHLSDNPPAVEQRLSRYIKKHLYSTDELVRYHENFASAYPEKTLELFKKVLVFYARNNIGRSHYECIFSLLNKMKDIKGGKKASADLAADFRIRYKNRRAIMEILSEF
jgi:hypothetical protein